MKYIITIIFAVLGVNGFAQETLQTVTDRGHTTTAGMEINIPTLNPTKYLFLGGATGYARIGAYDSVGGSDNLIINSEGGNVGIGTTKPGQKFVVSDNEKDGFEVYLQQPIGVVGLQAFNRTTSSYSKMHFAASEFMFEYGNVGIGTATPSEKLSVYGTVNSAPGVISLESSRNDAGYIEVGAISTKNAGAEVARIAMLRGGGSYTGLINFLVKPTNEGPLTEAMRIAENGNLLIGKTTQANAAYKLDINGKARASEIVVNTTGADFVFENSYKLRALNELEQFIKENKHLPEIPTANEMVEKGVSLGELNIKLLQKVEELTLYLIEKDKELIAQKEINTAQNKAIQVLAGQIKIINQKLIKN